MSRYLVIVESPTKAKTISGILGKDFLILSSFGHVRALPSKPGSVDVAHNFEPKYEILPQSVKHLSRIKKALNGCKEIYLSTDLDREGEAIAWHLVEALGLNSSSKKKKRVSPKIKRIVFHEVTPDAIREAMQNPRDISKDLVDAQQARVVLDYLYGFNLSPFLWRKLGSRRLSAGRVQSVALRLICEREKEIQAFKSQEYWSIRAKLSTSEKRETPTIFEAFLIQRNGKKLEKLDIKTQGEAKQILTELKGASFKVVRIQQKEIRRNPPPPFTTSTLQQEASRKLGFSAKRTMFIAQRLYEGIDIGKGIMGLITYMRTDSVHIAPSALREIQKVIHKLYGEEFGLKTPRRFRPKTKNVQEAHEAIRPTEVSLRPEALKPYLTPEEFKLYNLIWKRAISSQMAQAILDSLSADIEAKKGFLFRVTASTLKFPGFMKVYTEEDGERDVLIPPLKERQKLYLVELIPEKHFTQPPPRYTEASLVKTLEEYGIGRPSTYATIIEILQQRNYARIEKKCFHSVKIGILVSNLLVEHFSRYVDYQFTAQMESELDEIAQGKMEWRKVVGGFWEPFIDLIRKKDTELPRLGLPEEETEEYCPQCGSPLVIKLGRYGRFYACKGFPKCKYTEKVEKKSLRIIKCPKCEGEVVQKKTKKGKIFFGCNHYPQCEFALWQRPIPQECPQCLAPFLVEKREGVIKCLKCGFLTKEKRYANKNE